jgi:DNA-binding transcriptional ArsR family regulator
MDDNKRIARLLKVLSAETRVELLRLLKGRALCVNALAARLNLTPGAISQHLRVLRDAELVIDEKRGYYVHYHLNKRTLAAWQELMEELLNPESGVSPTKKGNPKSAAVMKNKAAKSRKT